MGSDPVNWETCSPQTGRISLDTHSLALSCFGHPRKPGQPVIIVIPGIASSIQEWPAVVRGLSSFARTYIYERSGFGQSDISPHAPTAEQIALELDSLLLRARVEPPYVIVCHSYGGIIIREFIHRRRGSVAGAVFVDANTEETPLIFPNAGMEAMQKGLNTLKVTIGDSHSLSQDEWGALLAAEDDSENIEAGQREATHYHSSGRTLMAKNLTNLRPPLLGNAPIVVLCANFALDLKKIYDAGLAANNGTSEERQEMMKFTSTANDVEEKMQRKTLSLSTNAKFRYIPDSGHQMHIVQPGIVIDSVKEVFQEASRTEMAE